MNKAGLEKERHQLHFTGKPTFVCSLWTTFLFSDMKNLVDGKPKLREISVFKSSAWTLSYSYTHVYNWK